MLSRCVEPAYVPAAMSMVSPGLGTPVLSRKISSATAHRP
jgi:hypothetical protein